MTHSAERYRSRSVSTAMAWLVIAIGALVLVGWARNQANLKSVVPGMITMKVNTAVGLAALAVVLLTIGGRATRGKTAVAVVGLAGVGLLAVATLAEYAFGVDLRIDNALFYDYESPRFPGRNAPATNVVFLGIAVGFGLLRARRLIVFAQTLLVLVAAAPLATLGAYLYQAPGLYQNVPYPVIALNTSVAMMMLCLGGLLACSRDGVMGMITSKSLAGATARKLLPAAVFVPLLAGLLVLIGQRADLYAAAFGFALLVACCSAFFFTAVCWALTLLWRTEQLRDTAERDRQQLFEAERFARGQAETANRMKDEFLSTISHELRTPLNAIYGWTQILRSGAAGAEELAQGLDVIDRNARAQTKIIEDLLDMSRIIAGRVSLDVADVDMSVAVVAAVDALRPTAAGKGVSVVTPSELPPIIVNGDSTRLQQIFWNLISNAIKFTPKGGSVRIGVERANDAVTVTVTDTGVGIDAAFLPFVFDRFRQADASTVRRHGGLGLGLAIVKELVGRHRGSVSGASPGVGGGSTFTVTLPVSRPTPPAVQPPSRPTIVTAPDVALKSLRILAIDDEADALAYVKRLLEDRGAIVTAVSSGADAFAELGLHSFDVLLSDIGMPDEDGYSVIRRVRHLPEGRGALPAIAMTAYARNEDRLRALDAGFQAHLAKPLEASTLVETIATVAAAATA